MKLKEIQNLIKFVAKSGASEVSLEMENVKITVKTSNDLPKVVVQEPVVLPQQQVISSPTPSAPTPVVESSTPASDVDDNNYITIKSPIIGTFIGNHHLTNHHLLRLETLSLRALSYVLLKQ